MDVRSYGVNKLDDEGFNTLEKIINDSELEWNDANILDDKDSEETLDDVTWRKCKNSFLGCPEELNKLFWRNITMGFHFHNFFSHTNWVAISIINFTYFCHFFSYKKNFNCNCMIYIELNLFKYKSGL